MFRILRVVLALLPLALHSTARAADAPIDGSWKLTFTSPTNEEQTLWYVSFKGEGGKLEGSVATINGVPTTTLEDLTLKAGVLRFTLIVQKQRLSFEGKVPSPGGKVLFGSFDLGRMVPARLTRTPVVDPKDSFEASKQILSGPFEGLEYLDAASSAIGQAAAKKAKPEEVRGWADKAFKAAEAYGPRWQRSFGTRLTESLLRQDGFGGVGLEYARRTERLVEPSDPADVQLRVLDTLANALRKSGKTEEVKEVEQRVAKLELQAYQLYAKNMPPFKVTPFAGRKDSSDRAVLVELFTGAECPPCVAADVGFDAVEKAYKPTEAVLLQYHLHIPGPDPLTNPASEGRQKYYGDAIEGTPTIFLNGKPGPQGGGPLGAAEKVYEMYRGAIDPMLETPAKVRLKASAVRKGNKVEIAAEASDLKQPGRDVKLRLVLAEDVVRYRGGNGQTYHHSVVRDFPGGVDGIALTEASGKQTSTVDLDVLRTQLNNYLTQTAEENPYPNGNRPMAFKKLRVVAFVQNDKTKEVLQAVQVEVPSDEVAAAR